MVCSVAYLARYAAQKERVRILYSRALKDTLNWPVHRHLSYDNEFFCPYVSDARNSNSGDFSNENLKHVCPVDTLALVRGLEAKGIPSRQAEAIASAMTQVLDHGLEKVSHTLVSKSEMEIAKMMNESILSNFKTKVESSQDNHFAMLSREFEKMRSELKSDNEKMKSELKSDNEKLRYEIDKASAGVRMDPQDVKVRLEAAKLHVIKYCIGTAVSALTVGLVVMRMLN